MKLLNEQELNSEDWTLMDIDTPVVEENMLVSNAYFFHKPTNKFYRTKRRRPVDYQEASYDLDLIEVIKETKVTNIWIDVQDEKIIAKLLLDKVPKVRGETIRVYKCNTCAKLYAYRFIPFGLGFGAYYNACLCVLTNINNSSTMIMEEVG